MTRWAYQFALMLALPWLIIDAWCRYFRAPESHRLPWAQFGRVAKDLPTGCVWLHAVSLGEIRAAAPLIRALQSRWRAFGGEHHDGNRCASGAGIGCAAFLCSV
ncbi:MAG: hypothetical protein B7X35_09975 [Halothiobacillus sp. 14-56-357]|nr:MAG: hypothetical protein B7X35_09975 [Halothiobacillus sp. 14-56-357]